MTLLLGGVYEAGRIINVNGKAYRVTSVEPGDLGCFPGGRGVRKYAVEKVADKILTVGECARMQLGETLASIEANDW